MNVSDLLRRPGSTRRAHLEVPIDGLANFSTRVDESVPISINVQLESLVRAIVANGRVQGRWSAACSRCLEPVERDFDLKLRELFEDDPIEDETYPIRNEEIDLEQPVRDLVLPDLPLVPLCDPECLGLCPTCGVNRNQVKCACPPEPADARFAPLGKLLDR